MPQYALEYGVSIIFYGYAFVYDTEAFCDTPPTGWADFFDTEKFPGTLRFINGATDRWLHRMIDPVQPFADMRMGQAWRDANS